MDAIVKSTLSEISFHRFWPLKLLLSSTQKGIKILGPGVPIAPLFNKGENIQFLDCLTADSFTMCVLSQMRSLHWKFSCDSVGKGLFIVLPNFPGVLEI